MLCECCGCCSSNTSPRPPDFRCGEITILTITVTTLAIGIIGALIYTGYFQIGWASLGMVSQLTGLYLMITGLAVTFLSSMLIFIAYRRQRELSASLVQTSNS